jgi:short-subunit dehydrogenase
MTAFDGKKPASILITGASSGIGAALATAYAADGVRLALGGRNRERLNAVTSACMAKGATAVGTVIDVTDRQRMRDWLHDADLAAALDLVIANAGISGGTAGDGESEDQARRIFDANLTGVLNTVHPSIETMRRRGRGRIAIMSSAASFRGFPGAPAYSASKATVRAYGEALRGTLHRDGIAVSVICPGFVRSRMTDANPFHMPMLMDADRAARIIRRGLARNRARIGFPWPVYFTAWLAGVLPPALTDPLFRNLPEK